MPPGPNAEKQTPDQGAARMGRRIAIVSYWIFLIYVGVVGFGTVVPQTFWPASNPEAEAPGGTCQEALHQLRTELRAHASAEVAGNSAKTLNEFLRHWDDRHLLLADRCGEDDRYTRLNALRYRVETTLRRFAREEARLFADLETLGTRENDHE